MVRLKEICAFPVRDYLGNTQGSIWVLLGLAAALTGGLVWGAHKTGLCIILPGEPPWKGHSLGLDYPDHSADL